MTEATDYPVLVTKDAILLPGSMADVDVERAKSRRAVDIAMTRDKQILVLPQKDTEAVSPKHDELIDVGVLSEIVSIDRGDGSYRIMLRLGERHRVDEFSNQAGYLAATATPVAVVLPPDDESSRDMILAVRENLSAILLDEEEDPHDHISIAVSAVDDPDDLVDLAAAHVELSRDLRISLLLETNVLERLRLILPPLARTREVLDLRTRIHGQVVDPSGTRERLLRERMKAIREELGEEATTEVDDLRERIGESAMSDEARAAALKILRRMDDMSTASPEYTVSTTYLGWLLDLPWGVYSEDGLDVPAARAILEADHAGLDKVKKRILEYIAVRKLAPDKRGPILCLIGPPGVGKTSLGRSIASALTRKYVRVSLGGVRDDAEIRGHRRTYVGSLPGRIINGLKKSGSMNPVFVLDEIDKLSSGTRGDPGSALLEVLDPEQNREFVDHYLEIPVDLSKVMFIATANQLDTIPGPLLDRLELIEVPGYTEGEKLTIARNHLLPKQMAEHGLGKDQVTMSDELLTEVISHYTRESGVRNLEREIASLCRSSAVQIASGSGNIELTNEDLATVLGPQKFHAEMAAQKPTIGVTAGLAWTPVGGQILFVEARSMPGTGNLKLTGQMGDVMQESAMAALSWLRTNADKLGISQDYFTKNDIHLHVPDGAVKKDGPSAGVAITTALASLFTQKPVRSDVAITGEVTLKGRVLPVGGIKSKVLAAHRSGIRTIVLPERNRKDEPDIPESVRKELEIFFVSRVEDAIDIALDLKRPDAEPPIPPPILDAGSGDGTTTRPVS